MNSPRYTEFHKVDQESFGNIYKHTSGFPPYSDFNPTSLYCWNANNDNSYTVLNGNLIIRIKDYLSPGYVYSVLGTNNIDQTLHTIFESDVSTLSMVPEDTINSIKTISNYQIQEDRDSFDYILATKTFADISAPGLRDIRKKISKFKKDYTDVRVERLDFSNPNHTSSLLELNKDWCAEKKFTSEKFAEEHMAISKYIDLAKSIDSIAIGIYINNKLAAFTLSEILNQTWAMGHFGKANNSFRHCSLFCEYATERTLYEMGIEFINIQQDAGLAGLRETKLSYHPTGFLKKYILTRATN